MWSQAHRYIFGQTALALACAAAAITLVIWLVYSLRFFDLVVSHALPMSTLLGLIALNLPRFLALALPIAAFCAVLFVVCRLSSDSELVALRAAGVSDARLAAAPLAIAVLTAILVAILNLWIAPAAATAFRTLQHHIRHDLALSAIEPGVFRSLQPGLTFYARNATAEGHFTGILIQDERQPDRHVTLMAATGVVLPGVVLPGDVLSGDGLSGAGGSRMLLESGTHQERDRATGRLSVLQFERYAIDLGGIGGSPAEGVPEAAERPLGELLAGRPTPVRPGTAALRAEAHHRLATILHAPALAVLALGLLLGGAGARRRGTRRVRSAVAAAVLLQAGAFAARWGAARHPWLTPAMYLLPALPLVLAPAMLARRAGWPARASRDVIAAVRP